MKMALVIPSKYILSILLLICLDVNINGVEASHEAFPQLESVSAVNVQLVHRTGYHFQPVKHWINGMQIYNFTLINIAFRS